MRCKQSKKMHDNVVNAFLQHVKRRNETTLNISSKHRPLTFQLGRHDARLQLSAGAGYAHHLATIVFGVRWCDAATRTRDAAQFQIEKAWPLPTACSQLCLTTAQPLIGSLYPRPRHCCPCEHAAHPRSLQVLAHVAAFCCRALHSSHTQSAGPCCLLLV